MQITNEQKVFEAILNCARDYSKFLSNKNFMFILGKSNQYFFVEALFEASNFLHLMGVDLINPISAIDFYDACLNHKLSIDDISLKEDGTSISKSDVSKILMEIHKLSRMYGVFLPKMASKIPAENVIGNDKGCIGFIRGNGDYLVPITLLKGSAKEHSQNGTLHQVVAVYQKYKDESLYKNITYIAKKSDKYRFKDSVKDLIWTKAIDSKIDKENLQYV